MSTPTQRTQVSPPRMPDPFHVLELYQRSTPPTNEHPFHPDVRYGRRRDPSRPPQLLLHFHHQVGTDGARSEVSIEQERARRIRVLAWGKRLFIHLDREGRKRMHACNGPLRVRACVCMCGVGVRTYRSTNPKRRSFRKPLGPRAS